MAARTEIDKGKTVLIGQFTAFMGREFDTKFNELIDSLKEKMTDRDVRPCTASVDQSIQRQTRQHPRRLISELL